MILAENCKAHFINNYATNTGGGIFISNTRKFISTKNCSRVIGGQTDYIVLLLQFQYQFAFFKLKHAHKCLTQKFFGGANNSAGKGGNIVYGVLLLLELMEIRTTCMDIF